MLRLLVLLVLLPAFAGAQSLPKYWIRFDAKHSADAPALSNQSLQQRRTLGLPVDDFDRPIIPRYVAELRRAGVEPLNASRWLNAISARLTPDQCARVRALPFVTDVVPIDPALVITATNVPTPDRLAPVMTQVGADDFARAGLTGRFVAVGVVDAGFFAADTVRALSQIFARDGVRAVRDYVNRPKTNDQLFRTLETLSDLHGTEVFAAIAGRDPQLGVQYGLATDAQFYLARTDQGNREFRGEEDNWVAAVEWMDSLGVRLINTSLGYTKGMTKSEDNYTPAQMDGHTSLISRAAQIATDQKGMLIVVSAGNEGDDLLWRIISTPADAEGTLAIGATNGKLWNRAGYSSIGPERLPYLKPNVSCFSRYGTSLSAPVITGFAACIMQADPSLTNRQVMAIIQQSAHLYPYGNNYVGYGVPQASRAVALLKHQPLPPTASVVRATGKTQTLAVRTDEPAVVVYHKKDQTHVLHAETARVNGGSVVLRRARGEAQTTVDLKKEVIEIIWDDSAGMKKN